MKFKEIFHVTRGTKIITGISIGISAITLLSAYWYYRSLNRADDPMLLPVKQLMFQSERSSSAANYAEALHLLDSALQLINQLEAYHSSYEIGVIYNNMASIYLMKSLYDSLLLTEEKELSLKNAISCADSGINNYLRWTIVWGKLPEAEIDHNISQYYKTGQDVFIGLNTAKIKKKRIRSILEAQRETPRRLSVAYTNLGTAYRHLHQPDSALRYFGKALELWDKNQTAKSNLNVFMGGKPVKPSVIEKLFPPEK